MGEKETESVKFVTDGDASGYKHGNSSKELPVQGTWTWSKAVKHGKYNVTTNS